MKNKLTDLNDHLFAQLERLGDEDLKGEDLEREMERAKAITDVSKSIVANASLQLSAIKLKCEHQGYKNNDLQALINAGVNA
ncbi:hypothetical protein [Oceanobacter sp. 3_MG-2023]|uniref:hypothetical protein n=1 Tax=Oceanobacter sp. 3_MG-2023 TaxID=3062622 RepID=UPI0027341E3F|nr:hypothetical protein [Oceanobacter sp. 3_MG-2023]MDP2505418.1 hypothetical protein [Oceanobacter sp. 3_MG-2023]